MSDETRQEVKDLFFSALEREGDERAAFLVRACADRPELRREVESLLASHEQAEAENFIVDSPVEIPVDLFIDDQAASVEGRRLGPYRLLREIGRGGMGSVYLAARADQEYDQQVAIKLVKRGFDHADILRRFRNERQILASLDHPNIAKLLDGGTAKDGQPYLVMEHIEGLPINEYCDQHRLPTIDRIKLFRTVCAAVHYAHQNLVIHRDLKPSNILVAAGGIPKLLDFGIAKLLDPASPAPRTQTMQEWRAMTPEYASPEQVRGSNVTTASDVYSLGVVLYHLLTGHAPYRLEGTSPVEIEQIVCEREPDKPSTAVNRVEEVTTADGTAKITPEMISALRDGQPETLRRRLRGDLDNIVMMALRKEPERRYASVEQLSEDLRRHLEGLPVMARDNTLGYRASKFASRHRAGVTAAVLIVLSIIAGMIATVWSARVARAERARAERRFNDVRQLANSFMFEFHDGIEKLPGSTPMREVVVRRALEYLDSLSREAGNDPGLQYELATAYERIGNIQSSFGWANKGDTASALESYRTSLALREALFAATPHEPAAQIALAAALGKVGQTFIHTHDFKGAAEHLRRAQSLLENLLARDARQIEARRQLRLTLTSLGETLDEQREGEQAMNTYRAALRLSEEEIARDPADVQARRGMAKILAEMGYLLLGTEAKKEECVNLNRRSHEIFRELAAAAPHDPQSRRDLALAANRLGDALFEAGDLAGAMENYQESLRLREELAAAAPNNPQARHDLATGYYNFGYALAEKGEAAKAVTIYQKAVTLMEEVSAADPANARFRANVASFYVYFGRLWEKLAKQEGILPATRRQRWEAARARYQRALTLINEMRAQNLSTGSAVSLPEQLVKHIARCDEALANR